MHGLRGWALAALCAGLVASAGCGGGSSVAKAEYDALKEHNDRLMQANEDLRSDFETLQQSQPTTPVEAVIPAARTMPEPRPATVTPALDIEALRRRVPSSATVEMRGSQPVIRIDGALVCQGANRAGLSANGKRVLDQVAVVLNTDFAGATVQVEGHTDSDPIKRLARFHKNNWELGYKRAQSVVNYLVSRGVSPSRLRATSFAEHRPVSTNKAKNRRVEIVVLPVETAYGFGQ